jgi:hypothetical protein
MKLQTPTTLVADIDDAQDTGPSCTMIITVESGVVTAILPTGPVEAVVVDLDMIENEDPFENRVRKAVLQLDPDDRIRRDDLNSLIAAMVREYRRPERRQAPLVAAETL